MDKKPSLIKKLAPPSKSKGSSSPGSGLIPLGARSGTPEASATAGGVKREANSNVVGLAAKRPRFDTKSAAGGFAAPKKEVDWQNIAVESNAVKITHMAGNGEGPKNHTFNSVDVFDKLQEAEKTTKNKLEPLMCGIIKRLNDNKLKAPDPFLSSLLCYLCRCKANYFQFDSVLEGLLCLLKRPSSLIPPKLPLSVAPQFKASQALLSLVSHVIVSVILPRSEWPDLVVRAYLEDSLGDRYWVDRPECSRLVNLAESAFDTVKPSSGLLSLLQSNFDSVSRMTPGEITSTSNVPINQGNNSPMPQIEDRSDVALEDSLTIMEENPIGNLLEQSMEISLNTSEIRRSSSDQMLKQLQSQSSFSGPQCKFNKSSVKEITVETLRDVWLRRPDSITKSLVKTMQNCCGYREVRIASAQKLDSWIQNPKLQRACIELMLSICVNCKELTDGDQEVITNLLKLRLLKSKSLANNFCIAIRELLQQNEFYLKFIVKSTINNEFTSITHRSPNNMFILSQCFRYDQTRFTKCLADVFYDFLIDKDDHTKNLRILLREIVKSALKFEFPFVTFCEALCERPLFSELNMQMRDKLYRGIEDLLIVSIFLGFTPSVKEAFLSGVKMQEKQESSIIRQYQSLVQLVQKNTLIWLQNTVPPYFKNLSKEEYSRTFTRILFLEKPDYYSKDGWPSEHERNLCLKVVQESPVNEEILYKICLVGALPNLSLHFSQAIDLVDQIVKKVAAACADGKFSYIDSPSPIKITKLELIELLFSCCTYKVPDVSSLPAGYVAPSLAVTTWYWRVIVILLIFGAHNIGTVGRMLWNDYPTMRLLMQMLMIGDYNFPPISDTVTGTSGEQMKLKDLQISELEKQEILDLENHLAATSTKQVINESNSHLLAQLMRCDPKGPARRPTPVAIEHIKLVNQQFHLGLRLSKSREPDFLLDIINSQGASHSLPWLVNLIQKNEGSLSVLPIQCLCEFLINQLEKQHNLDFVDVMSIGPDQEPNIFNERRINEMKERLRNVLWSENRESNPNFRETLIYFAKRLQAPVSQDRCIVTMALNILTSCNRDGQCDNFWLDNVEKLPNFGSAEAELCNILLKCFMVETDVSVAQKYLRFLFNRVDSKRESEIVGFSDFIDVFCKVINDRAEFLEKLASDRETFTFVASKFLYQLQMARQKGPTDYSFSSGQGDKLLMQWGETAAVLNSNFVSACLSLLAYDQFKDTTEYRTMCDILFPSSTTRAEAFVIDTTEKVDFITDSIKSRLLFSKNEIIVDNVLKVMQDQQVVDSVQAFGLPIQNVSKLLKILDEICSSDVRRPIFDKLTTTQMKILSKFVEAYRISGAENGNMFKEFITKNCYTATVVSGQKSESEPMELEERPSVVVESIKPNPFKTDKMENYVHFLFDDDVKEFDDDLFNKLIFELPLNTVLGTKTVALLCLNCNRKEFLRLVDQNLDRFCLLFAVLNKFCPEFKNFLKILHESNGVLASMDKNMQYLIDGMSENLDVGNKKKIECEKTENDQLYRIMEKLRKPESSETELSRCIQVIFGPKTANELSLSEQLLSIIPHEIPMEVLNDICSLLLANHRLDLRSQSVIDFIAAVVNLPRLWIGRDPKLPRHYKAENILNLSSEQIEVFLQYSTDCLKDLRDSDRSDEIFKSKSFQTCLVTCRDVLLSCLKEEDRDSVKDLVLWMKEQSNIAGRESMKFLLVDIYFERPNIIEYSHLDTAMLELAEKFLNNGFFKVDVITNRLLNDLFKLAQLTDCDLEVNLVRSILKKVVYKHPSLFVRQLPLISALLRGNTTHTMKIYYNSSYLTVFTIILELLECCKTFILLASSFSSFEDILNSFCDLLQTHALRNPRFVNFVDKVASLLNFYHEAHAVEATSLIEKNAAILQALSMRYPEVSSLKSLVLRANFALPVPMAAGLQQPGPSSSAGDESTEQLKPFSVRPPSPVQINQIAVMLNRLSRPDSSEEIMYILKDIKELSVTKQDALPYFMNFLEQLIFHKNAEIRQLSFELIFKNLNENPREAENFLPLYLRCFDRDFRDTAGRTAAQFLPDFCRIFPRDAAPLLGSFFEYSTSTNVKDNAELIHKAVRALHYDVS